MGRVRLTVRSGSGMVMVRMVGRMMSVGMVCMRTTGGSESSRAGREGADLRPGKDT